MNPPSTPGVSSVGQAASSYEKVKEPSVSSPPPRTSKANARTEQPKDPIAPYPSFQRRIDDKNPCGNAEFEFQYRNMGKAGWFIPRNLTAPAPTYLNLDMSVFRDGVLATLRSALERLLRNRGFIQAVDITTRVRDTANLLANGCCVATYMRLKSVIKLKLSAMDRFMKKPKVPEHFDVPAPFALAIQQLGMYRVSSLTKEVIYCPTMTEDAATTYGLPAAQRWSAPAYLEAVEYAKSVGMQFATVDLSVQLGSAWWLYKPFEEDDLFELRCVLPEDNYTEETAVLRSLWCVNGNYGFVSEITDLSTFTEDYGSMLRNPHVGINVSTFLGMNNEAVDVWDIA